jgi:glycosyltransferase involved in cell wall biosynthesis
LGGHEKNRHEVVVHWRDWFEELYDRKAYNVLHTCDHTYPADWKAKVWAAIKSGKLKKIICYRGWHRENMAHEMHMTPEQADDLLLTDLTFGVDPEIYTPSPNKDRRALLWSSDPGRGLMGAIQIAIQVHSRDKRFKLHVCHPDYVKMNPIQHPAIVWHGNVPNGPALWKLFNETGMLIYTSTFREPSSRACRQAQAAGSLVFYPPDMGTPSEYIRNGETGVVRHPSLWAEQILAAPDSTHYDRITRNAVAQARSESWEVQAQRFKETFARLLGGK